MGIAPGAVRQELPEGLLGPRPVDNVRAALGDAPRLLLHLGDLIPLDLTALVPWTDPAEAGRGLAQDPGLASFGERGVAELRSFSS